MLSKYRRANASISRYSCASASRRCSPSGSGREFGMSVDSALRPLFPSAQRSALRLERPVDERREAAGFVLQIAEAAHMFDPFGDGLDVAEHHRATGFHAQLVGLSHDFEPLLGIGLAAADFCGGRVSTKISPPPPGIVSSPVVAEAFEHFGQRHVEYLVKGPDFRWAESMNMDGREAAFDVTQQIEIPREGQPLSAGVAFGWGSGRLA